MTLWAIVFVVVGLGLCIYGANGAMAERLGEREAPVSRTQRMAATGRQAMVRVGLVMAALGAVMFVLGIVIHVVMALFTVLVFVGAVVAVLWVFSLLRRPPARRS